MSVERTTCTVSGFRAIQLANELVSMTVVPELGAKIVSLRNVQTNREWCWHPGDALELFANDYGASFANGPHVGIDECFPTIEECSWLDRSLPCHGEVWTDPWTVAGDDAEGQHITTSIRPRQSPFTLSRRVSIIERATFRMDYTLENHGLSAESFIWALHPLLRVRPGDRLSLPADVNHLTVGGAQGFPSASATVAWPSPLPGFHLDRFELGENRESRIKAFTPALEEGWAEITNDDTEDLLEIRWDVQHNPYLGLWMTRGGYRDIHYVAALEPTNAPCDSLTSVAESRHTMLSPGERRQWSVSLRLA